MTFYNDWQLATGDGNVIFQVKAAIHSQATNVYVEQPSTTIASGSNAAALPQATINVVSTTGWPTSGTATITLTDGTTTVVSYTGVTATTLTGGAGGVGTMQTNQKIVANTVSNHAKRASLATAISNGQDLSSLVISAVCYASLTEASTDTVVGNAVAALWNLWSGA